MRAVICRELGPPESLRLESLAPPRIRPGTVRVAVRACGVNFPDVLMIAGKYQTKPDLPFTPGMESAGIVTEIAPDVTDVLVGDRVMIQMPFGGFADEIVVGSGNCVPIPEGLSLDEGACFLVAYRTAHHALTSRANLRAGETLLVHGAAGGVGLAAVEIGKRLGATVIAVASTAEKRAVVEQRGADHVLDPADGSLVDRVRALTDGLGVDVICDPVGGAAFDDSMRCIAWAGRLLVIGFASGTIPSVRVNRILIKACSVIGVRVGESGRRDPALQAREMHDLMALAASGILRPHISHTIPLEHVGDALRLITSRVAIGRVVMSTGV
jgi:NADPH2:quinone reductase